MILELHRQGLSPSAIARQLGIDRKTVRKYIALGLEPPSYGPRTPRPKCTDNFLAYLRERLDAYPGLTAVRLWRELGERGFTGGYTTVKRAVQELRPDQVQSFEVRFETPPGLQAQVDLARFEVSFTDQPGSRSIVWLFSLVLGYSRLIWARYVVHQDLGSVLRCHVAAFEALGGAPREILYDRMKTAVIGENADGLVIYNRGLLDLARHFGFQPKACRPYRPQTKGKVERPFRYIREDFFLARSFRNLDDLNLQLRHWLDTVANARLHATTRQVVNEAFATEQPTLASLPLLPYRAVLRLERRISHEGMISVGGNAYSVPDTARRRVLEVHSLVDEIRILEAGVLIASHLPLQGRHQQRIDPAHRRHRQRSSGSTAQEPNVLGRAGDMVARRSLDFYDALGQVLAVKGRA
jgi:transposase